MPEMTWEEWYESLDVLTIMRWIVEHNEQTEDMDKINKTVFPFSSKFVKKANYTNQHQNG